MTVIHISFCKQCSEFVEDNMGTESVHYNFYNNNMNQLRSDLEELLLELNEPFKLTITFRMEDELSFALFCETLSWIYINNNSYNHILTINALISKDDIELNNSCYTSAYFLSEAIQHILFDVKLFYIIDNSNSFEYSTLRGKSLYDKLKDLEFLCEEVLTGKPFDDPRLEVVRKFPLKKPDDIELHRSILNKLFASHEIFEAFMADVHLSFDDDCKIANLQNKYRSFYEAYKDACESMDSIIEELFETLWFK